MAGASLQRCATLRRSKGHGQTDISSCDTNKTVYGGAKVCLEAHWRQNHDAPGLTRVEI